jgi:glycosyltransferase involved in cell wall biosynthesis
MKISVVTPNFNMSDYIEDTILSVLGSISTGDEYIIIDGGSTDGSTDIIRRYSDDLTYWVSEPDSGYAHALAKGFSHATGDIFCWVNSSDMLLPGALACVRELMTNEKIDFIYGDVVNIDEKGSVLWKSRAPCLPLKHHMLYGGGTPWQVGCFWRSEKYHEIGGINSKIMLAADFDFFLRLAMSSKYKRINRSFGAHRRHDGQLSIARSKDYDLERGVVQKSFLDPDRGLNLSDNLMFTVFRGGARIEASISRMRARFDKLRGVDVYDIICS